MSMHVGSPLASRQVLCEKLLSRIQRTLGPRAARALPLSVLGALAALSTPAAHAQDGAPLHLAVSVPPIEWMVDQLAGEHVEITTLVKPGDNPHAYDPTPRQVAELSTVPLYLAIGVPFEQVWLPRLEKNNADMQVVHLEEGLNTRHFGSGEAHHHDHGADHDEHEHEAHADHDEHEHEAHADHDEHEHEARADHDEHEHEAHAGHDEHEHEVHADHDEHEHGDLGEADPHLWLDPQRMQTVVERSAEVLEARLPQHASEIDANEQRLLKSLSELDEQIAQMLAPYKGRNFLIFHPSFGYFADRYSLEQHAIEVSGREPTPREMATLITRAKDENIGTIFVSGQFSQTAAKRIASSLEAEVAVLDPLAEDYLDNLKHATAALKAGFELTDRQ
ncbi:MULTISPECIES: metal ABC transporter solute-binding protein, Zn/Mn family [unclassified Cobetia]|uniref:metal ABC transporter solute-binding protein, Zn/Mn family n=1 Tax=unclassified Cobetia TaxID=2609414 RepID=UPI0020983774|nr:MULTISPECIES: zinc ABC transporter substrate-binding protein [unclassified Cobetia]MCO7233118.1 zinc ABC transporter substrate-binding protein [Cobetia sp. Dlab-2-AX]MCO7236392.1 zinc ABC transporter substrate-binding protein [Cobetia sp. Dlab-2-U]